MLDTCIVLNGPPNSGKDTLAFILQDVYGFSKQAMKDMLYSDTAEYFRVDRKELVRRASDRKMKEESWGPLNIPDGVDTSRILSPRDALIHVSETVKKPKYGDDYFGKAAAQACVHAGAPLVVFSDGGFPEEVKPLQKIFQQVVIFRLYRDDCSFEGDSRDYLRGFPNTFNLELVDGKPHLAIREILDILDELPRSVIAA